MLANPVLISYFASNFEYMGLDVRLFDLRPLKKYFYYYVGAAVFFGGLVAYVFYSKNNPIGYVPRQFLDNTNMIIILFAATFLYSRFSKKELEKIIQTKDDSKKFEAYISYSKKRTIWNLFSLLVTAALFLATYSKVFLIIFILQLSLSIFLYPRKSFILQELKERDLEFTS